LKKDNGFTLIEILIAAALLMTIVITMVPIISLIQNERHILSERRNLSLKLHDELQPVLWADDRHLPSSYVEIHDQKEIVFLFEEENDYVKGCVEWENVKKQQETFCLYGSPEQ
jgi:type II secretory pathway component PulJ